MRRGHLCRLLLLGVLATVAPARATEYLVNGDFEQRLARGWSVAAHPGDSYYVFDADSFYDSDRDVEAYVEKYDADYARIAQSVTVPGPDLFFGYSVRLSAREYGSSPGPPNWAAAALVVYYQDQQGNTLGETRIAAPSDHCPWRSSPTVHMMPVPDSGWHSGSFSVRRELESLPGVIPDSVRRMTVAVLDTTNGGDLNHCDARAAVDDLTLYDTLARQVGYLRCEVRDGNDGVLDPGEAASLVVKLRNSGPRLAGVTGAAVSLSPYLSVADSGAAWGSIAPGDTADCAADAFGVVCGFGFAIGEAAPLEVAVSDSAGAVDTLVVPVMMSDSMYLPTGPDAYGYSAFDDRDTACSSCPLFGWIEVEGVGTRLVLADDQTIAVRLPAAFGPIRYYGAVYDSLSVCSNGWVAPGYTERADYGNTGLPSGGAPPNVIAVNWDDLYPPTGGGVWYMADTINHRLVVEWDSVAYYGSALADKFEVVVHDRTTPTPTGDNLIVCQYLTGGNYLSSTFGMQNRDGSVGLEYGLNGRYPATSVPVDMGRAIAYAIPWPTAVAGTGAGPALRAELRLSPLPFRDRVTIAAGAGWRGPVRVTVRDEAGRTVRQYRCPAGGAVRWDGRDRAGRRLPAGVYFVEASDGRARRTAKAVMVW